MNNKNSLWLILDIIAAVITIAFAAREIARWWRGYRSARLGRR